MFVESIRHNNKNKQNENVNSKISNNKIKQIDSKI